LIKTIGHVSTVITTVDTRPVAPFFVVPVEDIELSYNDVVPLQLLYKRRQATQHKIMRNKKFPKEI
jgi:hypothetical protein